MRKCPPVHYQFQNKGKFALLIFNHVYVDLPPAAFRLSDGTWVMPGVPVQDLGIWKEWIGSIRMERLGRANLVLLVEEYANNPEIMDEVHERLGNGLKCQGRSKRFPVRRRKREPPGSFLSQISHAFGGGWSGALRRPLGRRV